MSLPLIVRREAEQDLVEIHDYYNLQRAGLGAEFLQSTDEVFTRIRQAPEMCEELYKLVRRSRLHRFPYVVYYRLGEQRIEVLAIVHASRDPRVWQSRT